MVKSNLDGSQCQRGPAVGDQMERFGAHSLAIGEEPIAVSDLADINAVVQSVSQDILAGVGERVLVDVCGDEAQGGKRAAAEQGVDGGGAGAAAGLDVMERGGARRMAFVW